VKSRKISRGNENKCLVARIIAGYERDTRRETVARSEIDHRIQRPARVSLKIGAQEATKNDRFTILMTKQNGYCWSVGADRPRIWEMTASEIELPEYDLEFAFSSTTATPGGEPTCLPSPFQPV
jgi:hypothetical protein